MISFIFGLIGVIIALVGWFGYHSLVALIVGTVLYLIETIMQLKELNQNAITFEIVIAVVGCLVSGFFGVPFYVGGMVAINLYSVVITFIGIPGFIALFAKLFKREDKSDTVETVKITYCKKCGGQLDKHKKCMSCGKQYLRGSIIVNYVVGVIVVALFLFGYKALSEYSKLLVEKQQLDADYIALFGEYQNPETGEYINGARSYLDAMIAQSKLQQEESIESEMEVEDITYCKGVALHHVEGERIKKIGYDSKKNLLVIQFGEDSYFYGYGDVPITIYNGLSNAGSVDGYYDTNIRLQYDSVRLD